MRKFWLMARHEYLKIAGKKSFLLGTMGLPVLIVVVTAVSILATMGQRGKLPVGYVDESGLLAQALLPPVVEGEPPVVFRAFADEASGESALRAGEIQSLYILPAEYVASGEVEVWYLKHSPGLVVQEDFSAFLQVNLLADYDSAVRERVLGGSTLTIRAADGSREFEEENFLDFLIPFGAAFFFLFAVMNAGGYMLQAVTDEKENRTIEVLATSLRPEELIGGKALGLMCVGLTQLAVWVGTAVLGLVVASFFTPLPTSFSIPWSLLVVVGFFFLPAYALIAGMMTAIGGVVTDSRQGQQISGILNLFFMLPLFFLLLIMTKPNSPLVIAFTLFPTTAFITIILRWALTVVPLWQLVTSWLLLTASAGFSVWAAARIFRLGMLSYGQQLSFKRIVSALRKPVQ